MQDVDATHASSLRSWVSSAQDHPDFPIQNLPLASSARLRERRAAASQSATRSSTCGGYSQSTSVLAATALQVGDTSAGRMIDRVGLRRVLIPSFLLAALTIALVGQSNIGITLLVAAITIAGVCVVGGQPAVNALAASYYPTALRATGVGWTLGIVRFGSILGPVLGGR